LNNQTVKGAFVLVRVLSHTGEIEVHLHSFNTGWR